MNTEVTTSKSNKHKLKDLMIDVLLLDDEEFRFELKRDEIGTWDSLAVVSVAVGIQETFGYHPTPEEATALTSISDIVALLETKGISFAE